MTLEQMKCKPTAAGVPSLTLKEAEDLLLQVPGWNLSGDELVRDLTFKAFRDAVAFVGLVADLAENEDHHPAIHIDYRRVRLSLRTHKINGLSLNDFILAAKVNRLGIPVPEDKHG
jgi:4a-hydroxytetrahydrobiopterin dehydratase